MSEIILPRKWTVRAHGQRMIFLRGLQERAEHVVMKALLWALYLPDYPDLRVEVRVGDHHYKPDVVQVDAAEKPLFWGEAGMVSKKKIETLTRRYRSTHFVITKWNKRLDPLVELVTGALGDVNRDAPFDLISFEPDSFERFFNEKGEVTVSHDDLTHWVRLNR